MNPQGKFEVACSAILLLSAAIGTARHQQAVAGQTPKTQDSRVTVRYTDIRQSTGITFDQDSTQTDEKHHLETMGTSAGTRRPLPSPQKDTAIPVAKGTLLVKFQRTPKFLLIFLYSLL